MKRRLFNVLAVISLLMCVATSSMWIRSYWWEDLWRVPSPFVYSSVYSCQGHVAASWVSLPSRFPSNTRSSQFAGFRLDRPALVTGEQPYHQRLFAFMDGNPWAGAEAVYEGTRLVMPYWFFAASFALLPLWYLIRTLLHRQKEPGHCATCNYDLRATPDRCPECGRAVDVPREARGQTARERAG
jgi:predicted RNA-binding Zn-ribbon protein involved in translation (DUF1610 family)